MVVLWLALLLPQEDAIAYRVDTCELNEIVSPDTGESRSYWVWWKWAFHCEYGWQFYVVDWRGKNIAPYPEQGVQEWQENGKTIRVYSKSFLHTKTFHDREIENRNKYPQYQRQRIGIHNPPESLAIP